MDPAAAGIGRAISMSGRRLSRFRRRTRIGIHPVGAEVASGTAPSPGASSSHSVPIHFVPSVLGDCSDQGASVADRGADGLQVADCFAVGALLSQLKCERARKVGGANFDAVDCPDRHMEIDAGLKVGELVLRDLWSHVLAGLRSVTRNVNACSKPRIASGPEPVAAASVPRTTSPSTPVGTTVQVPPRRPS